MSLKITDDAQTLKEGRKNTLKDAEVSLRDQIQRTLYDKLQAENIAQKITSIWYTGNADRSDWLNRQQVYLKDWDEFLNSTAEGPFQGSSSLHMPMPLIVAKTLHARFLQTLIGTDPSFSVKPRTAANLERAQLVQDVMGYALKDWSNNYCGIESVLDDWLWDWITTGVGLMKQRWDVCYERFVDVVAEPELGPPIIQVDPQTGREITIPTTRMKESEQTITKKIFEGPVFEHRHIEDILIVGGHGDPNKADAVIDRQFLTASRLWTLADQGIFDDKAVAQVIAAGSDKKSGSLASDLKNQRALEAGKSDIDSTANLDRYEILEAYLQYDVDKSGINSEIIVWIHLRSRALLRATYLRRTNRTGERPFFKIDFHRRPGEDYGIGIVEMMHPLSVEMDAMHNMRVDFGILASMPFGFYKPTSSLDPTTIQLEPGSLIPLDNPQTDIYFPNLGNRTSASAQEEAVIQSMIEKLTTTGSLQMGITSGEQGAARTATGARALLGEANSNLDVYLRRLYRGWKSALNYLLHTLQQRIPQGLSFRITGESGDDYWRWVRDREDISGDYDFEMFPNSANSNPAIQQEVAQQILQVVSNPLDIQLGIITPATRYEALKNYLKSFGVKDFGKYLQQPPDNIRTYSPEEEVQRILLGIPVPVTPQADHQGYLDYFEKIKKSDELLGKYSESETVALAAQAQQHQQMLQAMQQLSQQQRNAQQMQMNSQSGPVNNNRGAQGGGFTS